MAFYDVFERLCNDKGVTPTQAGRDNGIAQGVVSMWKKRGSTPQVETVKKLADYFGVPIGYLIDDSPIEFTVSISELKSHIDNNLRGRKIFNRISDALQQMDDVGQRKVADYAEDILPRYRRQEATEGPPTVPECQATPTSEPPPESPSDGE